MPSFGAPNPLVLALLRSPLHRLASSALVALEVKGRKTGREHVFPVMYAREGETLIVVSAWASKKRWWRNVTGDTDVGLLLRGERRRGIARVIPDSGERGRLLRAYVQRFPSAAKGLGLAQGGASGASDASERETTRDEDFSARLADAVVVTIRLADASTSGATPPRAAG